MMITLLFGTGRYHKNISKERKRGLGISHVTDKSIMFIPKIGEDSKDFEGLKKVFSMDKKNELKNHCKNLAINQSDLLSLIMAAKTGILGSYGHHSITRDLQPEHLEPGKEELTALSQGKVGCVAEGKASKTIKKISQMFIQRRFLVAHFFYTPDHSRWHLMYLDQRDISTKNNHWVKGSHLHLINWLWRQYSLESVLAEVSSEKPNLKGSLHIQYKEQSRSSDPFSARGDS